MRRSSSGRWRKIRELTRNRHTKSTPTYFAGVPALIKAKGELDHPFGAEFEKKRGITDDVGRRSCTRAAHRTLRTFAEKLSNILDFAFSSSHPPNASVHSASAICRPRLLRLCRHTPKPLRENLPPACITRRDNLQLLRPCFR